jgi:hypothetical protein
VVRRHIWPIFSPSSWNAESDLIIINTHSELLCVSSAVVGLLAAALYNPMWIGSVNSIRDLAIALAGFVSLQVWRVSALRVVPWCVAASTAEYLLIQTTR